LWRNYIFCAPLGVPCVLLFVCSPSVKQLKFVFHFSLNKCSVYVFLAYGKNPQKLNSFGHRNQEILICGHSIFIISLGERGFLAYRPSNLMKWGAMNFFWTRFSQMHFSVTHFPECIFPKNSQIGKAQQS